MENTGFWSRVGSWLKRPGQAAGRSREDTTMTSLNVEPLTDADPPDHTGVRAAADESRPLSRLRFSRSGHNLQRLEEEYARIVNLIDGIEKHLASQAEQSQKMARSLEQMAVSLTHAPEASQKELELLSNISDSAAAGVACTKRAVEGLIQLPQLADAQREATVSIDRQLDVSQQTTERLTGTMAEVRQAITRLGEATEASTTGLNLLRCDAAARDERVAGLLETQTRRLTIFAWSALGLALVAAAVGLVALLR